jgi:hypothetical protein
MTPTEKSALSALMQLQDKTSFSQKVMGGTLKLYLNYLFEFSGRESVDPTSAFNLIDFWSFNSSISFSLQNNKINKPANDINKMQA